MRKGFLWMALIGLSVNLQAQASRENVSQEIEPVAIVQDGIRFCESTYPYNGGILIANFGTSELNPLNSEERDILSGTRMERLK